LMGFGGRAFSIMIFIVKSVTLAFEGLCTEAPEVFCLVVIMFAMKVGWQRNLCQDAKVAQLAFHP
jgi:hypothetical protein